MSDSSTAQDAAKRLAAQAAVADVESGMVLGLGSGSTALFALEALAERVRRGLHITGIPTSDRTAAAARRLGIPLASFAEHRRIDLAIDGADEVELGTLNLIKGRGGALLREKIVAAASDRLTVIVDDSKLVDRLGRGSPLPVEVVPFGVEVTIGRLADAGGAPVLRLSEGKPFVSDSGHCIADCRFGPIVDPAALERRLRGVVGVVETGLFIGYASRVIIGSTTGLKVLER